jgi:hypothetical protein
LNPRICSFFSLSNFHSFGGPRFKTGFRVGAGWGALLYKCRLGQLPLGVTTWMPIPGSCGPMPS